MSIDRTHLFEPLILPLFPNLMGQLYPFHFATHHAESHCPPFHQKVPRISIYTFILEADPASLLCVSKVCRDSTPYFARPHPSSPVTNVDGLNLSVACIIGA